MENVFEQCGGTLGPIAGLLYSRRWICSGGSTKTFSIVALENFPREAPALNSQKGTRVDPTFFGDSMNRRR
jgi:hypothetical protein